MRQFFCKMINAGDATGTITSGKLDARQVYSLSVNVTSTDGTNAGALKLQGSNAATAMGNVAADFTPPTTSWADIPSATATVASGGIKTIVVSPLCYAWVRAVWTPSAGAGTLTVEANGQGF